MNSRPSVRVDKNAALERLGRVAVVVAVRLRRLNWFLATLVVSGSVMGLRHFYGI